MAYVLTKNGDQVDKYPYSFYQLQRDNPMVSFPAEPSDALLSQYSVEFVNPTERPDPKLYDSVEGEPIYENGQWKQTWISSAPSKESLIQYAKDVRYEKESAGLDLGGIHIATDRESQVKIVGARVAANSNPDWFTVWDAADGNTHMIDAETMIMISNAVEAYVNGCFVIYAGIKSDIDNGLITTYQAIDEAFENALT